MRTQENRARRPRQHALGLVLVLALIGAAALAAQTHQSGGSTTVIVQSGAGPSQSQVTVYPDGQKVITRDGQSTDISVQRGSAGSAEADRFDWPAPAGRSERFSTPGPAGKETLEGWPGSGSSREALRQRMLERMRPPERF